MNTPSFKEDQISQIPALQILHYANTQLYLLKKELGCLDEQKRVNAGFVNGETAVEVLKIASKNDEYGIVRK